jgi:hypothetical protein
MEHGTAGRELILGDLPAAVGGLGGLSCGCRAGSKAQTEADDGPQGSPVETPVTP